jgi:hypothetical protein
MPRIVDNQTNHYKKWNMYVNEIEKTEYLLALTKAGKARCQSAAVRAFMFLYATDEVVRNKINAIVDKYMVYNDNGSESKL